MVFGLDYVLGFVMARARGKEVGGLLIDLGRAPLIQSLRSLPSQVGYRLSTQSSRLHFLIINFFAWNLLYD